MGAVAKHASVWTCPRSVRAESSIVLSDHGSLGSGATPF